jgi:hypothetical protein
MVQSHLVRFGFVKDYTIWTFHGKKVDLSGGASGGNSSTMMTAVLVNADPVQEPISSSSAASAGNGEGGRDYITIEDIFDDMANNDDGGGEGMVRRLL